MQTATDKILSQEEIEAVLDGRIDEWTEGVELAEQDQADVEQELAEADLARQAEGVRNLGRAVLCSVLAVGAYVAYLLVMHWVIL